MGSTRLLRGLCPDLYNRFAWFLRSNISLAETSLRLPRLISRGNSGDSGDQKMACALTKATSRRRLQRWQPIRPQVAGTSRRRLRDVSSVAGTSPAVAVLYLTGLETRWWLVGDSSRRKFKHVDFWRLFPVSSRSRRRLRNVSETYWRRRRNVSSVSLVSSRSRRCRGDVSDTCWRLENVSKNRTCFNSPRLPGDPASLQETSRRRLRNQRRLESPTSRHLVSRPVR